jgi:hypothetical protein
MLINDTLKRLGKPAGTDDDVKKFVECVDRNSDGKVTKVEFEQIFTRLFQTHSNKK